ncbi:retrovirus-related pol polyprotein from transposon TNT 1-94 [Tanacetum coccineum]|uniref:Retrovirus-related pol polyprotein from transposon TNT 1-94 n=1 Tax=Tanacetum coccineum TaxID=301880 RepID=A0ABQ4YEC9_9ASTR
MWARVERLMRGTIQNQVDRETRFTNEFDQFVAEPGESLVSVYNRFAQLMNDLERNNMKFQLVSYTKFMNRSTPNGCNCVTQVRLAKRLTVDSFDDLFDYLSQFEKLVNASRAKKLEKSHDPLALVAHTGLSSRNTSSYYVTHPSSVVDYDEEYEQDDVHNHSEDPLASAMLLLAKAITQNFSNPTNNRLRASSNTKNQAVVQGDRVNIQSRNSGNVGRNNRRAYVQGEVVEGMNATNETANVQRIVRTPTLGNTSTGQCNTSRVRDLKYFMEQMLLAKQDEAGVILTDEQNNFLFADASRMEEIEELSANICLMARIQPADQNSDDEPSYESAFCIDDDQSNSYIQFDPKSRHVYVALNSGSVEKDIYVYDQCALETLARNAYDEAAKQQRFAQKVQQQNMTLTKFLEADERAKRVQKQVESQLYRDRDIIRDLEKQRDKLSQEVKHFKQKNEELQQSHLILKRKMSENEDKYHDTILDLEEKLKKNVDLFLKIGNSLQAMFMLGPKPLSVYDQQLKHGLGYPNPYTLRQAISECPKLYVASRTGNIEIPLNVRDSEETLVVTQQESQTNKTKNVLSSTGMNATSSVKRPKSRDSHVKTNSVLDNSKKAAKNVAVYVRKNKQTDVIPNKENVIDVDVANAFKAKTLLCVSCMKNVLIPCHNKCVAKHKLNVCSNVRRTFSTNSRQPKSPETTFIAPKTRFFEKKTQSKTLDTTFIVSKSKIDVESASKAKDKVVQIVLWVVDSGCSKHMTGDRSLLRNFIEKFMGTVRFGNDNFAAITGYGDYIHGNITICHVYYVEGLGHNLFSVGQFCDGDLEVAFHSNTCYVRNLEGDDLLTGGRDSNLYTISISDMAASSPVCLMSKATSTKSCKKASHPPKLVPSDHSKLELLHMDLCGPMRVASINGKRYILVIVDDYSRYTWVYFLRSKDETPEIIKKFIAQAQLNYKAKVCKIRTDNVERRSRTLVEAAHTMLIFSQLPEFRWAEAVATTLCLFELPLWATERLDADLQGTPTDQTTYRRMIGGLMYLTASRLDIAFATFVCARYQARPTVKHLKEVKRIFRYLRQSYNMGLWYLKDSRFKLIAYSDADHAGCKDDCKSTSGGLQFLGGKLVSWSSKKQDCTAMSTAEAEYVSLSACCAQVIWMRTQLLDYGYKYNRILMYCDSKSAIAISCNPVQHSKTKHIDIRYHFIKEHVEKGTVEIYFVGTEYQLADLFTKALPKERFEYLVHRIADVHPDELCPPKTRYDLMDANKKVDLEHVQSSSFVPWIYMAQFWHTLKEDRSKYRLKFMLDKKELTLTLDDFRQIFHLPQATANNHNAFVPPPSFSDMVPFYKQVLGFTMELETQSNFKTTGLLQPWQTLCKIFSKCLTTRVTGWDQPPLQIMQMLYFFVNNIHVDYAELLWEGLYYSLHHATSSIPYSRFTKIVVNHYMTIFPDISRRARDMYHNLQDDDIMKNIFNSGRHKTKTTSAPRSPNPDKEVVESSAPSRSTMIRLRLLERRSTRLTPPAPVPTVDKADEMILQDTLQVSLAEHKSREEQEARENVALVDEHLASEEIEKMVEEQENIVDDSSIPRNDESNIPGTRIEPRSDKESPEVEIAKEKEVEITQETEVEITQETPTVDITNVIIPVNVTDEDEEITDEVYELKRREKGKNVEETRNSPIPTPIRSPRIHINLVSSYTEKL